MADQPPDLDRFDHDDAWRMGSSLATRCRAENLPVTISIWLGQQRVFHAALPGTSADNDCWIERKIRVVNRFNDSSYLVGRRLARGGRVLDEGSGAEPILYAPHGGCFPIIVRDVGVVGTVAVSGLPQAEDHAFLVEMLEAFLGGPASGPPVTVGP
jgi:uncharacterized protein (UPF0303 family)